MTIRSFEKKAIRECEVEIKRDRDYNNRVKRIRESVGAQIRAETPVERRGAVEVHLGEQVLGVVVEVVSMFELN
jgi:hypothetical protein